MPSKAKRDENGSDVLGSNARITAQAVQFIRYCLKWALPKRSWPVLHSVTLYPPAPSRPHHWLVVGKATGDQEWLVSFHRATDPLTALVGFLQKVHQGTAVWKADKFVDKPTLSQPLPVKGPFNEPT